MLPRAHRLVRPADFKLVFRRGSAVSTPRITLHLKTDKEADTAALVGFVVPKKEIKLATARNLVKRRLRHCCAEHLELLKSGDMVVVRAKAAALHSSYTELAADYVQALRRARQKVHAHSTSRRATAANTAVVRAMPTTEVASQSLPSEGSR